jgi:hypothetical protein
VNGVVHVIGEHGIDLTLTIHARFSSEALGCYFDPKMRLAAFSPTGMAVMFVGLVDNTQFRGLKRVPQLMLETIGNLAHGKILRMFSVASRPAQRRFEPAAE